ncbi:MAG: hypothetical protein ACI9U2_001045 [Bradymonadia bacterium]|jgi:hypothetical protein
MSVVSLFELDPADRPRERLLKLGASALEPPELLALVLGSGRGQQDDVLTLAHRILEQIGGLGGLGQASVKDLMALHGIGPVKATRVHAALEIARRVALLPAVLDIPDPLAAQYERLRGQMPPNERIILGYRPDAALDESPVTLGLGEELTAKTRSGAVLARLLAEQPDARWWVVAGRPKGRVKKAERAAARRLADAASLLGMRLDKVLLFAGQAPFDLLEH